MYKPLHTTSKPQMGRGGTLSRYGCPWLPMAAAQAQLIAAEPH